MADPVPIVRTFMSSPHVTWRRHDLEPALTGSSWDPSMDVDVSMTFTSSLENL